MSIELGRAISIIHRANNNEAALVLTMNEEVVNMVARAMLCVQKDDPQVFDGKNYVSAREAWMAAGVSKEELDALVDPKTGAWIYDKADSLHQLRDDIRNIDDPTYFIGLWAEAIRATYAPVQHYLDATAHSRQDGFNGHMFDRHIVDLVKIANIFFEKADLEIPTEEMNQFLLALMAHDAGNGFNRSAHAAISVGVLYMTYGREIFDVPELLPALQAIFLHDEKTAMPLNSALVSKYRSFDGTEAERNEAFLTEYAEMHGVAESLLRIFDKADTGRNRIVNTIPPERGRFERDLHFFINAAFSLNKREFGVDQEDTTRCIVQFDFSLQPDPEVVTEESAVVIQKNRVRNQNEKKGRKEIEVPQFMRERYKEQNVHYFMSAAAELLRAYEHRVSIIVLDILNVLKTVNTVVIRLVDPESGNIFDKQGQPIENQPLEFEFSRETILSDIQAFAEYVHDLPTFLARK